LSLLAFLELFAFYAAFGAKRNIWELFKRELILFFDTASILLRNRFDTASQKSEAVSKTGRSNFEEITFMLKVWVKRKWGEGASELSPGFSATLTRVL
jgi:hypothetical protein